MKPHVVILACIICARLQLVCAQNDAGAPPLPIARVQALPRPVTLEADYHLDDSGRIKVIVKADILEGSRIAAIDLPPFAFLRLNED